MKVITKISIDKKLLKKVEDTLINKRDKNKLIQKLLFEYLEKESK